MVKVSDIIFCVKATNVDGEGASANIILTSLLPEYIPGLFTFSVIVTILGVDLSQEHNLLVQFFSPEEQETVRVDGPMPIMEDDSDLPLEYRGVNVAMDWTNVNFKTSGIYTIVITLDGEELAKKEIYVKGKN